MRRRSDSWLNATQLLKVAGFDKPQRTRVLERDVQKAEHEKVQGGYGKYQGRLSMSLCYVFLSPGLQGLGSRWNAAWPSQSSTTLRPYYALLLISNPATTALPWHQNISRRSPRVRNATMARELSWPRVVAGASILVPETQGIPEYRRLRAHL